MKIIWVLDWIVSEIYIQHRYHSNSSIWKVGIFSLDENISLFKSPDCQRQSKEKKLPHSLLLPLSLMTQYFFTTPQKVGFYWGYQNYLDLVVEENILKGPLFKGNMDIGPNQGISTKIGLKKKHIFYVKFLLLRMRIVECKN